MELMDIFTIYVIVFAFGCFWEIKHCIVLTALDV